MDFLPLVHCNVSSAVSSTGGGKGQNGRLTAFAPSAQRDACLWHGFGMASRSVGGNTFPDPPAFVTWRRLKAQRHFMSARPRAGR